MMIVSKSLGVELVPVPRALLRQRPSETAGFEYFDDGRGVWLGMPGPKYPLAKFDSLREAQEFSLRHCIRIRQVFMREVLAEKAYRDALVLTPEQMADIYLK
jgi:hypothetical protein